MLKSKNSALERKYLLKDNNIVHLHKTEKKSELTLSFRNPEGKILSVNKALINGKKAEIRTLVTHVSFGRKKLATSLLRLSLRKMKERGVTHVETLVLSSARERERLTEMLENHGFELKEEITSPPKKSKTSLFHYSLDNLQNLNIEKVPLKEVNE